MKDSGDIEGVIIQPLKQITDQRGSVLHMMNRDSELFKQFGEIYFSEIHSGLIKAWKRHKNQTQNVAVPINKVRLVIFDPRPDSKTQGKIKEYELGRPYHYKLIQVPPMVWYGYQNIWGETALIANCVDQPHNPKEKESLPADSDQVPYQWKS